MELRIVNPNRLIIMDHGARVGGHNRSVVVEIQKPDEACSEQQGHEDNELFLLIHAAVLKYVLRCSATLMTFADA